MPSKQEKAESVELVKKLLSKYPVVAVASLQSLPSRQYNAIKKSLRGKAEFVVARSTLLKKAIDEGRPELKALEEKFEGSTALIFTTQGAFGLAKTLNQNRSKTTAKPGQLAPEDLVVPAGETNLPPGPVLTELKQAGLKAKIKGPKVVIEQDATVAKKGEAVTDAAAKILAKLGIEPIEVGLRITAAWEGGTLYPADILNVDEQAYFKQIQLAYQQAVNLGVFAEVYNATTTPLIVAKAAREANAVKKIVDEKSGQPAQQAAGQAAPAADASQPQQ